MIASFAGQGNPDGAPPMLQYLPITGASEDNDLVWSGIELGPNESATLTYQVNVGSTSGTYNNFVEVIATDQDVDATATNDDPDSDPNNGDGVAPQEDDEAQVSVVVELAEINVQGNNTDIDDGDTTPDTADDTDFGDVLTAGGSDTHTFTIQNVGNADLIITSVTSTGADAPDFTVAGFTNGTIAGGNSETFTVTFDPSVNGTRTATIEIVSDDTDEMTYNFALTGNGLASPPEINVQGQGQDIADGDAVPDSAEGTDFGTADTATGSITRTFTVQNTGAGDLNVSAVNITGADAGEFTIQNFTAGTVAPGGTLTFDVVFDPTAVGVKNATVEITNDDADENPYDFAVTGNATTDTLTPEADLSIAITESPDPMVAGTNLTYTVTVNNAGPSDAQNVVVTSTLPAGVTFVSTTGAAEDPTGVPTASLGTITAGSSVQFTIEVTVDPSTRGTITLLAGVTSDTPDPDTNNNDATEDTTVNGEVDLVLSKTESLDSVIAGSATGNLSYVVTVTNNGPSDATGVEILEDLTLPAFVSIDSVVVSAGTFGTTVAPDGLWIVDLPAGASETLTLTLTVGVSAPAGLDAIVNTVSVSATSGGETRLDLDDDRASVATSIRTTLFAVGADAGGTSRVRVFNLDGSVRFDFLAYGDFAGGVRVATGDINGDGTDDIITGAGPGGGSHVKIFDGTDLSLINEFFAYVDGFMGGVFVASGDVNGDGLDDVITGAGPGGTTHVRVFGGGGAGTLAEFFAYDPSFAGGVQVAAGDVDGDGLADIITGAGPGGTSHVKVIDAQFANLRELSGLIQDTALLSQFFAYDPGFTGGVFVAAGDVNGDGRADILTGAGPGGGSHVKLIDAEQAHQLQPDGVISDAALLANFFAYEPPFSPPTVVPEVPFTGGVRVALDDRDGDGVADLVTAPGPDAVLPVVVRDTETLAEIDSFFAYDDFAGGVFVS